MRNPAYDNLQARVVEDPHDGSGMVLPSCIASQRAHTFNMRLTPQQEVPCTQLVYFPGSNKSEKEIRDVFQQSDVPKKIGVLAVIASAECFILRWSGQEPLDLPPLHGHSVPRRVPHSSPPSTLTPRLRTFSEAMKQVIALHLNGEPQNTLIMPIIRFVLPEKDHTLKKLVYYFWEVTDKVDEQGRLLEQILLIWYALPDMRTVTTLSMWRLLRDLEHPNEYVRGLALRFLAKLKCEALVEHVVRAVPGNLSHRHSYVRRHAVMAISVIYERFPHLIPDAPDEIFNYLETENDVSARRNAFIMLYNCAPMKAVAYLHNLSESEILGAGDVFQLAVVDLLKHMCKTHPQDKSQYLRLIFALLGSKSAAVLFQCATTLYTLSSSPTAIREAGRILVNLLNTHSDNNVRLIVLDRIAEINKKHPSLLKEHLPDLMRALTNPNEDIRSRILDIAQNLTDPTNLDKVTAFLKKEVVRAQGDEDKESWQNYRQMIVKTLHNCTIQHPEVVAPHIMPVLLDLLTEPSSVSYDVVVFVRELIQKCPSQIEKTVTHLQSALPEMLCGPVIQVALWVLAMHSNSAASIISSLKAVFDTLQPLPLMAKAAEAEEDSKTEPTKVQQSVTTLGEDGTYVTVQQTVEVAPKQDEPFFRSALCTGHYFLHMSLASCLVKLLVRSFSYPEFPDKERQDMHRKAIDMVANLVQVGEQNIESPIDDDALEHLILCQQILSNPQEPVAAHFVQESAAAFTTMLEADKRASSNVQEDQKAFTAVDTVCGFAQLVKQRPGAMAETAFECAVTGPPVDLEAATKSQLLQQDSFADKLKRVHQLTGFADPVYAEAVVTLHQFDILLEITVVNQTKELLQNLSVELITNRDSMKLCERPQSHTVAPGGRLDITANVK
eukprot:gene5393-136_t